MKPIYFLALVGLALLYLWRRGGSGYLRDIEMSLAILFFVICGAYWVYDRFWGGRRK